MSARPAPTRASAIYPIRRDKTRSEREAFLRLKAELARVYAAPDDTYRALSASDVIEKNGTQPGA